MATPRTIINYARDGLCKQLRDLRPELPEARPDTRKVHWLLNNRTDVSDGGGRILFGRKGTRPRGGRWVVFYFFLNGRLGGVGGAFFFFFFFFFCLKQ